MVILLALYLKPVIRLLEEFKYGYANNVTVLNVGRTLKEIAQAISEDDVVINLLGAQIDIAFNTTKTKAIYFTRARNFTRLTVTLNDGTVLKLSENLRYLGVYLNPKLTFQQYVEY